MDPRPATEAIRTGDGSRTLLNTAMGEPYHSRHGAVQESTHVFIEHGLMAAGREHVAVLEVGLGTGLNLLLTWIRCLEGKVTVDYTALEPFPLGASHLEALAHAEDLAWPGLHEPFIERMTGAEGRWHDELGGLRFRRIAKSAAELDETAACDAVYFDAFAPAKQPELWTPDVFTRMHNALRPGGLLVTYCAKGDVRRAMLSAGFAVERLPGPPGKREMLRAMRPR
jgi:tRNA U34 5-methylaminomethyl-2-thiouridine-forming methyltransferase MnmC